MPAPVRDTAALYLAAIVASCDDAIVSKDLDGIITSWNRAAERMFGYTAAEAVGRSILLIIPDERRGEETEVLRRIRCGEMVDHFETVRRRKDGSSIDISLTVSPVRDEDGVIIGASKIARDITEQKQAAAAFADLQSRLLAVVEASASLLESPKLDAVLSATVSIARAQLTADGHALWRAGSDGTWRAVRSLGVSGEFASRTLPGSTFWSIAGPLKSSEPLIVEDVLNAPPLAGQADAYRSEGVASMAVFPLTIAGSVSGTLVFYYRTRRSFSNVEVQTGRALANLAATAITTAELYDRQEAYHRAAEAERQRFAFLAQAGATLAASLDYEKTLAAVASLAVPQIADWCAVDVLDDEGRLQRLAIAHIDPKKVEIARTLQERYPEPPNARGGVHEVLRTGKPAMMSSIPAELLEAAARDADQARMFRELAFGSYMCVPLAVRNRTFGAMTFVMAESGRHYNEDDLRLAGEVALRASLAVENARAYQRVNEASRLKDEFLATLSHELRTPLNAILGYARMLRLGLVQHEQPKAMQIIERNAVALNQIIEEVLDVSRIVSGKLRLNVRPVQLPDVLEHATATVQPAATAKGVRVETRIDLDAPAVWGDADRLQQVVWNLLTNAVKFTPRGGRVEVRLERVESQVAITVADTGEGIDPAFLPHVFERFRQAHSGFARHYGGLGLGLAIVREIVEMHGGTVQAQSEGTGAGSTFVVKLPVMSVNLEAPPQAARALGAAPTPYPNARDGHRLDGISVLVVDDEQDSLSLLQTILETAGADVRTAGSAEAALRELEHEAPDVLVSDLGMPGMDGLALVRAVRRAPSDKLRALPAVALTAYARSEDRVTALASGFQMHVAKPTDPAELVVAILTLARGAGK